MHLPEFMDNCYKKSQGKIWGEWEFDIAQREAHYMHDEKKKKRSAAEYTK